MHTRALWHVAEYLAKYLAKYVSIAAASSSSDMKTAHSPVKGDQSTRTRSGRSTVVPARHNSDASPFQQKAVSAKQRKGATVSNQSQQVADQPTQSQPEQPLTSSTGFDQIQANFTRRIEQLAEAQKQQVVEFMADLQCAQRYFKAKGARALRRY